MKAVNIIVEASKKLTNNKNAVLNLAMFVIKNPHLHKSIIENETNFVDLVHDVRGLMQDDQFFVPRVLTTNKK
jgi:hypothetical protein